jgi:hypothetical protein
MTANMNLQNGFTPILNSDGSVYTGQGRKYYKGTAAGAIAVGDVVVRHTASTDPLGGPEIVKYTVGSYMTGVVVSIDAQISNISAVPGYLASGTTGYVYVEDNPFVIFEAQEGGSGTALTVATAVGNCINSLTAANASALIGRSVDGIDNNAISAGNTWYIYSLAENPGNAPGAYCRWWLKPSLHTELGNGSSIVKEI